MIPRLLEVFFVSEASLGNVTRLLGFPENWTKYLDKNFEEHLGLNKKFAYLFMKLFKDDKGKDPKLKRAIEIAKANPENPNSVLNIDDVFASWHSIDNGMYYETNPQTKFIVAALRKNPSLEKKMLTAVGLQGAYEIAAKYLDIENKDLSSRAELKFPDGFYWVKLDKKKGECDAEGGMMQHCGMAEWDMYSLRDKEGKPHVTIEMNTKGSKPRVLQVKGKQNNSPNKKYWKYIGEFISFKGAMWNCEEPMGNAFDFQDFIDQYKIKVED